MKKTIAVMTLLMTASLCQAQSDYTFPMGQQCNVVNNAVVPLSTNAQNQSFFFAASFTGSGVCNIIESNTATTFVLTNPAGSAWNYIVSGATNQYFYVTNTYNVATYWTNSSPSGGTYPTNTMLNTPNIYPLQAGGAPYVSAHSLGGLFLGPKFYQGVGSASGTVWWSTGRTGQN